MGSVLFYCYLFTPLFPAYLRSCPWGPGGPSRARRPARWRWHPSRCSLASTPEPRPARSSSSARPGSRSGCLPETHHSVNETRNMTQALQVIGGSLELFMRFTVGFLVCCFGRWIELWAHVSSCKAMLPLVFLKCIAIVRSNYHLNNLNNSQPNSMPTWVRTNFLWMLATFFIY